MVTCKEPRAVVKKGFTGKDIAASKIAPKSTIYWIIRNFKESGSIVMTKASVHPKKSSKHQDHLLKSILAAGSRHHQYRACSGMAAGRCENLHAQ